MTIENAKAGNEEIRPRILRLYVSDSADLPHDFSKNYHTHLLCHRSSVRFMLDNKELKCGKDEFVFWLAGSSLQRLIFAPSFRATVLLVENQLLSSNVPDQKWGMDATLHSRQYPVKKLDDRDDQQRVLSNFRRLHDQFQDRSHRFYEEALKLQTRLFILEMWHIFANEYERRKRSLQSGSLYERFAQMVDEHCATRREVQFYAQQLHISAKHLNYVCVQNSGTTASALIQRFTTERIMILLQNKHLNIAEIAAEMEFSSRSFFTRYVKKQLGMTPTEYRNRLD